MKLTKVNVTHRRVTDPGVLWLISNGFRLKCEGNAVFLVRQR